MIRVLIADDQWHYARALEAELDEEPDLEIVAVVHSAEAAVETAARVAPQVVLLDLDLPSMGGVEACRRLVSHDPDVAVVMVTVYDDEESWLACTEAGARGYVVKRGLDDPARVAERLRSAARGDVVVEREMRAQLRRLASRARSDPARDVGLTGREREILPLLALGLQDKEIALRLGVGAQTVRNHVSSILKKLSAANRTAAVAQARRLRILE